MYILGISCYYHDASAALLKDGVIVAAAEQERFSRKKHDTSFPLDAIRYCLDSQGATIKDIAFICFYEKPLLKLERVLSQHLATFPLGYKTFLASMPAWLSERLNIRSTVRKKLGYRGEVLFVEHHLAHAASAFLVSPFRKAAILTIDGVGEWTTTAYGVGEGNGITLHKEIAFPHSLGLLYSTITAYLGFTVNNSEYKVMGLSAYGTMDREKNPYYGRLRQVVDIKEDGSYRFDMSYFIYHHADRMPSRKLCALLGGPVRKRHEEVTKRHKDIAAALQLLTEEMLTRMLRHVHAKTGCESLVLAGGVALNSVFNGKILKSTPFKNVWIQPNASDGGTSMGAASYAYHALLGNERTYVLTDASLGPGYTTEDIKRFLDSKGITYTAFKGETELLHETAKLISQGNVVGWFQGRMEWGPRALGNRSILADPTKPEMQDILNSKVKHREMFRPFAPAVCVEDAQVYFECDTPLPEPADFMLMVYPLRKEWQERLPAVTHVDGSGRLQTVRKEQHPLYYALIREFGRLSGIPVLVNTSFNIRGEPIVCTPFDAYNCMMGTGIDYLVIDRFLVKREDNPQHMWDSERYAKD